MLEIYDADIKFRFGELKINIIGINYGVFYKPYPRHRHGNRFYEAHLVCSGRGTLIAEGEEYPLSEGVLYMTGPMVTHEQLTDAHDPMDEYCLRFEITGDSKSNGQMAELLKNTRFWLGRDTQNVRRLFEMLSEEDEKKAIGYIESVKNLASEILIALVRCYGGGSAAPYARVTPDDKRMVICDESFLYGYAHLTLGELSRRLNLSNRQTQRFLKKAYGKTFIELRREMRKNKAEELVKNGMSLSSASRAVGYEDTRSIKND